MIETPQSWPCTLCLKPSRDTVHASCRQHVYEDLAELPALYRQLGDALQPSRRGDQTRGGTRTAPLPCSLDALDLRARGGIQGVLTSWEDDVRDTLDWEERPFRGSIQQDVDGAAAFLQNQLAWICDSHPAAKELGDEIRQIAGQARRLITGERPARRIPVACPCGQVLRVTLDTPGVRCGGCETQYGHADVLRLPMAQRTAA
ncbi:hypothetical protein ACFY7H_13165 [Streptomyces sp. NPDC012794]|uniref:DUF7341 domain-containing protein n=1 Tax=Streptomyces sp. NPDC012794 TaxID=3364850 RepID=UPI00367F0FE2